MENLTLKCAIKILIFLLWIRGGEAELKMKDPIAVIPPNFTELAKKAGLHCEEVDVTTEDGYILTMFHIPGNKHHPVFIQSGNLGSSDDYMTRGKTSLPYILNDAGYDVWVGNVRGCRYGRRHVSLNPDKDDKFWKFYMQEFAVYDTAAMIDYILDHTHAKTVTSIGWSCGTTINFILAAEKPEYNKKIDAIICLAPIGYLDHSIPFTAANIFAPVLNKTAAFFDINEVLPENSTAHSALRKFCSTPKLATACLELFMYPVVGFDSEQIEPDFAPIVFQHYPSSTSRRNELHLSQIVASKRFAKFDYGSELQNKLKYGRKTPPEYDLKKVTTNVVLISGKNDQASKLEDVARLKKELPNVVDHIILKPKKFNHLDFVCGRDTHKILYTPIILEKIKKYNNKHFKL